MSKIIYLLIFFIMLVSLLANPAPVSIELSDMILIILPLFLFIFTLNAIPRYKMYTVEINLFLSILFYLLYLLTSMLMGLLNGANCLIVLRSIGPYINFAPLLFIASLSHKVNVIYLAVILIIVGILQSCYLFYLYFLHSIDAQNTLNILINRITLLDPHTTLPLVLSLVILPLSLLSHSKRWIQFLAIHLFILGIIASAVTLTRSLMIASVLGTITFIVLYGYYNFKLFHTHFFHYFINIMTKLICFIPIYFILISIPPIYHLEQGLMARFLNHAIAGHTVDYSNGRLFDEWLPALSTWANNGFVGWFFGIGAGETFTITSGEERTYIHNLSIYSLVYGGFFGLVACLWLYFTVFKTLLIRAFQTHQIMYLGFASLLLSMFIYGQFFAVHKGLAFNAMLYLLIVVALIQPRNSLPERKS